MGVNLVFEGFCERCLCADLELSKSVFYENGYEFYNWKVKCVHEDACRHMMDVMEEKSRK